MTNKHGRPWLHVDLDRYSISDAVKATKTWLVENKIEVLNIAGPRASKEQRIYEKIKAILSDVFRENTS